MMLIVAVTVSTVSRLRDGIGFTVFVGGVGYAVYYLLMVRYVYIVLWKFTS